MGIDQDESPIKKRPRTNRWSDAASSREKNITASGAPAGKALAQSIAQRLAALKQKKLAASRGAVSTKTDAAASKKRSISPLNVTTASSSHKQNETTSLKDNSSLAPSEKRAKVYDFDMNVISRPSSVYQKQKIVPKKNPYLAHREKPSADTKGTSNNKESTGEIEENLNDSIDEIILDGRLVGGQMEKMRKRNKPLTFVRPGTYIELAEKKREKAINAVQSGFTSGRKVGLHHKSVGIVSGIDTVKTMDVQGYYGRGDTSTERTKEEELEDFLPPRADALIEEGALNSTNVVVASSTMPLIMEWWDIELLPTKLKKEVATKEGDDIARRARKRMDLTQSQQTQKNNADSTDTKKDTKQQQKQEVENEKKQVMELQSKCFILASISNSKTASLIQHPQPVLPLGLNPSDISSVNDQGNPQSTLHLTKKEMKRQRKLRRAEKQREQQDLQAVGQIPAPEPKLTLSNFMRVMGNQAVMDPSQMEKVVLEQMQSRKLKHEKMNEERKLSKEARSLKRRNKLLKEPIESSSSSCVSVALFLVKDMGHPYHRAKVDLNAQQMEITGGVLECFGDETGDINLSLVIAEGGSKVVKKYIRLMMVRMKWKGEQLEFEENDVDEGNDEENEKGGMKKFNPNNSCELVWTGLAPKRMFNSFMFQSCTSSKAARKILEAKGVAHFWDQVLAYKSGRSEQFHFKLGNEKSNDLGDDRDSDGDVLME